MKAINTIALFIFSSVIIFGSYWVMYFFSDKSSSYNFKTIQEKIKVLAKKRAAKPKASGKKAPSRRTGTTKVTKKVSRPKKKTTKRRVKHK